MSLTYHRKGDYLYLMGHSDVTVTLNMYTHMSYEHAAESMAKIIDLQNEVLQMCP